MYSSFPFEQDNINVFEADGPFGSSLQKLVNKQRMNSIKHLIGLRKFNNFGWWQKFQVSCSSQDDTTNEKDETDSDHEDTK